MLSATVRSHAFKRPLTHLKLISGADYNNGINGSSISIPTKSKVVICGGGLTAAAVAYYLARRGWADRTVILERESVGSGATKYSNGLIGMIRPTWSQLMFAKSSKALWKELESKGLDSGFDRCGSLLLARTRDRMTEYRRIKAQYLSWNIPCEIVTPQKCQEICPLIQTDDLYGGLWLHEDGVGDASRMCSTLLQVSKDSGLNIIENCSVVDVKTKGGKVTLVKTSAGDIECEYFVNCAGFCARNVGQMSQPNIKVPLYAAEQYYMVTEFQNNLSSSTPVVKDPDGYLYLKENKGNILIGGFQANAKAVTDSTTMPTVGDDNFSDDDWENIHHLLRQVMLRMPILKMSVIEKFYKYPELYSPDLKWIVGQSPEVSNYYVAAGTKAFSIPSIGGIGKTVADLIVDGHTPYDLHQVDISRFLSLHNNETFLRDRVQELPGLFNNVQYPFGEFKTGRNLRMSPIYTSLNERGAVLNQVMGYERPAWFDTETRDEKLCRIATTDTFAKPPWFDLVKDEYMACREAVGLCDYSSFTKIDLWSKGTEVVNSLQYLCSNDVDVPIGSVIHTGMQNHNGGYENDCSLVRLDVNHYMMIAPTVQQTRCRVWIERHLPSNGLVSLSDVTSMYTAICLMGPFSRILLSELTDTDLSPSNFPFFTYRELDVGLANGIRALNLTHTGELGYVLYIPNEFALHVYSRLIETGDKYGIKHVGYYAMRTLRVEKFYAFWGQDLDTATTPLECGRAWRVKFNKKNDFIGKEALLKQRDEGIKRQYVQMLLNDHDPETELWSWGGEPIYRDGKYCGQTTTTSYGFTFQKQVCLGFVQDINEEGKRNVVNNNYILSGDYEVDIAGIRYNAKVNLHSPNLPTKYPDQERESYKATREKVDSLNPSL
ncbi:pyruvate dehydrogenase phosphatase regulatory subunit, mitochondrial isoform X2 [Arctopsyche grandis]|uniref:pyruvate dehydrogenase phosphatase regulatory subunit, mitochondrial isoform X2 n=1 Tax=Arctopsyche grandis TaxID=121162 RepID=UPI00406D7082